MDLTELTALNALLDREIVIGNALLHALESEKGTLTGFDIAALEHTTAEKERLVEDFDRVDADRRQLVARLGFGPSRTDMVELIRAAEDPAYREDSRKAGPLATRWRRLVSIAERCKDANERNGLIVSMHTRRVTQTLNILRTGRPDELTYGHGRGGASGYASRALGRV